MNLPSKLRRPALFTAGVAAVSALAFFFIYREFAPIREAGPFNGTPTAFIRSEDGETKVVKAFIKGGKFTETLRGKPSFTGIIKRTGNGSYEVAANGQTLTCLSMSSLQAVCGSVRFQKSLGSFQFDRKVPFNIDENVNPYPMVFGSASEVATVMFNSNDGSFWMRSKPVGKYKFLTPEKFEITWKARKIYFAPKTGYMDAYRTRVATCVINKEIKESIICNGDNGYSAIWTFVDSGDSKNAIGGNSSKSIMQSHD
jgi:hypothetical protein